MPEASWWDSLVKYWHCMKITTGLGWPRGSVSLKHLQSHFAIRTELQAENKAAVWMATGGPTLGTWTTCEPGQGKRSSIAL